MKRRTHPFRRKTRNLEHKQNIITEHDRIAHRAYELYCERGRHSGHDLADWFQAELEIHGNPPHRIRMTPIDPTNPLSSPA